MTNSPDPNFEPSSRVTSVRAAGGGAAAILGAVALYQAALAAGTPWGDTVYGGRAPTTDGVLDGAYRWMSAGAAATLCGAAWIVAADAGIAPTCGVEPRHLRRGTRGVAAYLGLNTLMNLAGRHPVERWVLSSATAAAGALCVIVGRGTTR